MDQWVLEKLITIEGRDFCGRRSTLEISPTNAETGWVWNIRGIDIPITPKIMEAKSRRVALVHNDCVLNEFEHIGVLRAVGLHNIRVWCSQTWPPYDGGSFKLWQEVMPYVHKVGKLTPYQPEREGTWALSGELGPICSDSRYVQYYRGRRNDTILRMSGVVHFPTLGR